MVFGDATVPMMNHTSHHQRPCNAWAAPAPNPRCRAPRRSRASQGPFDAAVSCQGNAGSLDFARKK